MSRRKRNGNNKTARPPVDKKTMYANILRLLILIAITLAVFLVYKILIDKYFYTVMITYMSITVAAVLAYVIYNRGFSRRGVTEEMLPDTMSKEEKQEFIEDGKRRLRRSRPLFMVIFAFAFTFVMDIIELCAIPFFRGLLN